MLREYEVTIIGSVQQAEEEQNAMFQKYVDLLVSDGGTVIHKEEWGVKRLAFPMLKQFKGRFMHYDLTSTPALVAEAERLMKIDEKVLRFLTIRIGENVDIEVRRAEIAKATEAAVKAAAAAAASAKEMM